MTGMIKIYLLLLVKAQYKFAIGIFLTCVIRKLKYVAIFGSLDIQNAQTKGTISRKSQSKDVYRRTIEMSQRARKLIAI